MRTLEDHKQEQEQASIALAFPKAKAGEYIPKPIPVPKTYSKWKKIMTKLCTSFPI